MCLLLAFKFNKLATYDNKMQKDKYTAHIRKMKSVYPKEIFCYFLSIQRRTIVSDVPSVRFTHAIHRQS